MNATDSDNRNKLISKLKDKKVESTYAYFFCCIVAVGIKGQNEIIVCNGKVEGKIRTIERGEKVLVMIQCFIQKDILSPSQNLTH